MTVDAPPRNERRTLAIVRSVFGPLLKGTRVTLRPADDGDPERFVPWFADMEVTRYLGRRLAVALYQEIDFLNRGGE